MQYIVTFRLYGYLNTNTINKGKSDEILLKINMQIESKKMCVRVCVCVDIKKGGNSLSLAFVFFSICNQKSLPS